MNRTEWGKTHTYCMDCGVKDCWPPLQTHEILRGSLRSEAVKEPATWLRVCEGCHGNMPSHRTGLIRQLQIKLKHDPKHFNLEAFNRIATRKYAPIRMEELQCQQE